MGNHDFYIREMAVRHPAHLFRVHDRVPPIVPVQWQEQLDAHGFTQANGVVGRHFVGASGGIVADVKSQHIDIVLLEGHVGVLEQTVRKMAQIDPVDFEKKRHGNVVVGAAHSRCNLYTRPPRHGGDAIKIGEYFNLDVLDLVLFPRPDHTDAVFRDLEVAHPLNG